MVHSLIREGFLAQELQKEGKSGVPFLHVPHINHSSIKVALNASENTSNLDGYVLAGKHMSEEEQNDNR